MSKAKYAYMIVLLQYALLKSHSVFNSPHRAADLFFSFLGFEDST